MIQRPQTLLLGLAILFLLATLFVPIWKKENSTSTQKVEMKAAGLVLLDRPTVNEEYKIRQQENTYYLPALLFLASGVAAFSITSFKKRRVQMTLGWLNSLLIAGCAATIFFITGSVAEQMVVDSAVPLGDKQAGFFLPLIALICNFMSNRLIMKDERLVRSMDRLR